MAHMASNTINRIIVKEKWQNIEGGRIEINQNV